MGDECVSDHITLTHLYIEPKFYGLGLKTQKRLPLSPQFSKTIVTTNLVLKTTSPYD